MLLETSLTPAGTFYCFAAITFIGLAWQWFFLPETAGKSLESMDRMFELPWHVIGRKGAELTKGEGTLAEALDTNRDLEKSGEVEYVENVSAEKRDTEK